MTIREQMASDLCHEDLLERLGWLIRLRWMAAAGLFLSILVARYALHLALAIEPLLAVNAMLLLANAAYQALWRQWAAAPPAQLVRFGIVQMVVDFVFLAILLHYSGGAENPLIVTFVFQCIIASMLFTPGRSYLLAGLAVGLVGLMVILERTGLWPHQHLPGYLSDEPAQNDLFVAGVLVTLAVVLFVAVYLTTTIERASRRRRQEWARKSRELEEAREQMQQADKMAALGELAASMAHDINNPAGVLCARLEIMQYEGAFDNLPDRLRKDIATLQEHAQYLRRVAENWTTFARKTPVRFERVDLNEVVERTTAMMAESLLSHRIRLELRACPTPLPVRGDLVRLQQVVLNIINNARDAMPRGGTLSIRTHGDRSNGRGTAVIEIEDSGVGIAAEDLGRIFEPFFSKKARHGTGLGLAICQKIVKEMDGEIRVSSQTGQGSVFSIHLPVMLSATRSAIDVHAA